MEISKEVYEHYRIKALCAKIKVEPLGTYSLFVKMPDGKYRLEDFFGNTMEAFITKYDIQHWFYLRAT